MGKTQKYGVASLYNPYAQKKIEHIYTGARNGLIFTSSDPIAEEITKLHEKILKFDRNISHLETIVEGEKK